MADQVDEIKQKTDIVSLISEYIPLKKAGRNYKALCPFHSEKTPSFMVSPELQMYKCFGCGEAGDAYSFLEKYEGMEFAEALRFLAERTGVKLVSFTPGVAGEKEKLFQINTLTSKFYSYILLNHRAGKAALNYLLKERGLALGTIKTFQLGYSPDVPNVLKRFLSDKKGYQLRDLEKLGLLIFRDGRTFDRFRGRIMFPLFDHRGNIAGFAGRILPAASNSELAKYINSPEGPIYHKSNLLFGLNLTKEEIKKAEGVIVVEGELDMISSWQAGIKNVVAIKGSALTEEQVRLISRFTKKVTLALDADLAGDAAARRGVVIAQDQGLEVKVAKMGEFKDPDEAARGDPTLYRKFLDEAVGVWDYLVESVFSRFDSASGEGKAKISREIVPILASIPDKIVQAHYIEVVAEKLGVPASAVTQQIEDLEEEEKQGKVEALPQAKEVKSRRQLLEERLLSLAFQSDPKILLEEKIAKLFSTPLPKRMVEEYEKYSQKGISFSPSEFAEGLPKELLDGFAEMVLVDTEGITEDKKLLNRELNLVIRELEILEVRRKLEGVGVKIRQFEEGGQRDKLKNAQKRFGELSLELSKLEEEGGQGIILKEA
jgi:DNA primase